jgi:hypothetical protein
LSRSRRRGKARNERRTRMRSRILRAMTHDRDSLSGPLT